MISDRLLASLMGATCLVMVASPASAAQARIHYDIPSQALDTALRRLGEVSGVEIMFTPAAVADRVAPQLEGDFTLNEALDRVLAGTGLTAQISQGTVIIRGRSEPPRTEVTKAAESSSDILVTGSRIRGRAPAGAAVTVIDRKQIEQSGYATTQELLQSLPQNFGGGPNEATSPVGRGNADFNYTYGSGINLRGLGAGSTLVLLDGARPPMAGLAGVFTDLSMIPASAIERIEVLPDGASALYGSDAVAGVVNIIPRRHFSGLELGFHGGLADGLDEEQASAILGAGNTTAHIVLAYEYYRRSALAAADRPYASEDLRRYGLGDYRSAPGLPGTVTASDGSVFAIPPGQDGRGLTPGDLRPGAGEPADAWAGADILPAQQRHALYVSASLALSDNVQLFGQALYGWRRFDVASRTYLNGTALTVPVTNPFYVDPIGTGEPVDVRYNWLKELGPESSRGTVEAFGATAGGRLQLGAWQVELRGTYGTQDEKATIYNLVNTARAEAALADTDPATALNLFGDGSGNNPATLAAIRGSILSSGRYALWSSELRAEGPLLSLPAGDLRIAVGAEHRREHYREGDGIVDRSDLTPTPSPGTLNASRTVTAGYAELSLPLSAAAGGGLGVGQLDLSAAIRGEHYSDVGDTVNPKVGLSWSPWPAITLRGTFGTSFRAPNFNDLRQDPESQLVFAYPLPDPSAPGGVTNALIIRGNDPDLGPERATSWTLGLDVRRHARSGPFAQITYFDIDYRDRVVSLASALFTFFTNRDIYAAIIDDHPDPAVVAAYYASPNYVHFSNVPASAVTAIVDSRTQNLSEQRVRGLDFDFGYRATGGLGTAEIGVSGSYFFTFSQRLTPSAPTIELIDTAGNPTDLRLRGRATWNKDGFGAAAFLNYQDSYTNRLTVTPQHVASWATLDLQLSYRLPEHRGALSGLRLAVGATNLFDTPPPRTVFPFATGTVGYDLENGSPIGRLITLAVTKSW